ncbi:MAG: tRNA uridine-5-carboxymethylaminomethyl(34) synthesis GTPase MnmE [Clostridia bacterium]|nr:tRNA uridine-5-carboxymethylaminomethyl(34) synthesis GTPase MnmE [Clostridia bacterium]
MNNNKTIAAVATPMSAGGIGIIRISGSDAINVADRVFKAKSTKSLSALSGYSAAYGKVYDEDKVIDEAIALVFRAPKSYTGEDVVEISCHGGLFVTQRVLRTVLKNGAQPAEAGEFTKRAFLNGRIDLSKAEAVMNIISANGEQAANAAVTALDGALSRDIHEAADRLISVCANMSAWVDYPDEEIPEIEYPTLAETFNFVKNKIKKLLDDYDAGRAVIEGVNTAIVGKPNVGKSTLMNLLSGHQRSIVTPIAGTTRDVVEETVRLGGLVLRLADTAGIHSSSDAVETIGVELAETKLRQADLVFAVFDASDELSEEDYSILEKCKGKQTIAIINKTDLERKIDEEAIKDSCNLIIEMSARNSEGCDKLSQAVESLLGTDKIDTSLAMLSTERQRVCCEKALRFVEEGLEAINIGMTMDAINVCAEAAVEALLELTGEKATNVVVDEIFAQFCVGK